MEVVCIVQARMGSTRLPGKVLMPILGKSMLWWDLHRVQGARRLDAVVVATTTNPTDDELAEFCRQQGWNVVRGSEEDVLDRYYQAARQYDAAHIVRITSDCPLIDPHVVDYVVTSYLSAYPQPDYASNFLERTYPRGLDTEIFSMAALETAWRNAQAPSEREHVTPYIWRNPNLFRLRSVTNSQNQSAHRWTVDTPEDMELVQRIYGYFGHGDFRWQDVLALLDEHPEWVEINRGIEQKHL